MPGLNHLKRAAAKNRKKPVPVNKQELAKKRAEWVAYQEAKRDFMMTEQQINDRDAASAESMLAEITKPDEQMLSGIDNAFDAQDELQRLLVSKVPNVHVSPNYIDNQWVLEVRTDRVQALESITEFNDLPVLMIASRVTKRN